MFDFRALIVLPAVSVGILLSPGWAGPSPSPASTVITVGGKAIKRSQIDTIVSLMAKAQTSQGDVSPTQLREMEKMVASNLIGQELLEFEAKAKKIGVTPGEIDSAVRILKANFPDEASFQNALKGAGDTEAKLKEKLGKQIRSEKVMASQIDRPVPPTETEMTAFWKLHQKEFPFNDSLRALQIVMVADAKTPPQEVTQKKRKLETLREELIRDSGSTPALIQHFGMLASRNSDGPEGKVGGDLGRFHPNDFNAEFKKQVQALRVGQLSPVFRTALGFHLVLLIEKYDGKFESYKLQVMQNLAAQKNAQTGAALRKLLKGLAAKYPVKYLSKQYIDSSEAGIYN